MLARNEFLLFIKIQDMKTLLGLLIENCSLNQIEEFGVMVTYEVIVFF